MRTDEIHSPFCTHSIGGEDVESTGDKKIQLVSIGEENNHFEIDKDKKTLTVNSVKHPYTPIKVFKALLKIALSLIDESELHKYEKAFKLQFLHVEHIYFPSP